MMNQVPEDKEGQGSEIGVFQEQAGQDSEKKPKPQEAKAAAQVINAFDKNGDGKIDRSEAETTMLRKVFEGMKSEGKVPAGIEWNADTFDQGFKHVDRNESGYIESDEIEAFVKELEDGMMDKENTNQMSEDHKSHDGEVGMLQENTKQVSEEQAGRDGETGMFQEQASQDGETGMMDTGMMDTENMKQVSEDQDAQDGEMGTRNTENTNHVSQDQKNHDGEMGLLQENRSQWFVFSVFLVPISPSWASWSSDTCFIFSVSIMPVSIMPVSPSWLACS